MHSKQNLTSILQMLTIQNEPYPQNEGTLLFRSVSTVILAVALMLGIAFRLRMYLQDRSLWLDTANLAINVVEKNYAALWGLLDGNQSAPVGFLFASKLAGSIFGYSESVLLFLPFIFGTGALVLFLILSVDVLGRLVAPIAFIPFASSSTAIYYSGEFKQYSADLFFSVLILLVTHRILKERSVKPWILSFGIVGVLSVWFSNTAVFMIAGTGLALLLNSIRKGDSKTSLALVVTGSIISLHFLGLYFSQIRTATVESMFAYWAFAFAPFNPFSSETFSWWFVKFVGYAKYPLGFHGYGLWLSLTALVFGLGVSCVVKSKRVKSHLFVFPVILLVIFSCFQLYPIATGRYDIHSRLVLFTIPIAYVLIAEGISGFAKLLPKPMFITVILGLLLAYSSINHMTPWPGFMKQEMKPLVAYLYKHYAPVDSVYVYSAAIPAFRFYTKTNSLPFVQGTTTVADDLPKDLKRVLTDERVWAVISHDYKKYHEIIRRELETHNGPVISKKFPGAWLLLSVPDNLAK